MSDITTTFLKGDDRVETLPEVGRPLRMGTSEALAVSDLERIVGAFEGGDEADARARLEYVLILAAGMLTVYMEIDLALVAEIAARVPPDDARSALALSWDIWRGEADAEMLESPLRNLVEQSLAGIDGASADAFRRNLADGRPTLLTPLVEVLTARCRAASDGAGAASFVHAYRLLHDMLALHSRAQGAAALQLFGQPVALAIQEDAFHHCAFFQRTWKTLGQTPPDVLIAGLAEHLRFHMSGPDRAGTVRIVEASDCYRVVVDPCGSGGAMRRRVAVDPHLLPDPSPFTWGRAGEVPMYCAHCAMNELESVKRLGYPLVVTEFDPDPMRSCGWTVYKHPGLIPARFYTRLGFDPPPARGEEQAAASTEVR